MARKYGVRLNRPIQVVVYTAFAVLIVLWFWRIIPKKNALLPRPWMPPKPEDVGDIQKAIIVPAVEMSEIGWLKKREEYEAFIYCMGYNEWPECHKPHTTKGREAAAYLSYIVDYYDELPKYNVFVHGGETQVHNDILGPKTDLALGAIRFDAVDRLGYMNLRCINVEGCPVGVTPHRPSQIDIDGNDTRARYVQIYMQLFNVTAEEVPDTIGYVCCAQFVVTREQVRKRPKADYARMLNWLMEYEEDDSHAKGWVLETLWHTVFSKGNALCPRYEQCRCDVYGWCGPLPNGEMLKAIGA